MEIREVRREDAEIFVEAYIESYRGLENYAYRRRRLAKGYFRWLLGRDSSGFMAAELDGRVVGFVACDTNWFSIFELKKVGEIHEIFVLPECRRRGVASRLLSSALLYAKGKGRDLAELYVGETNEVARKFYEKNGFAAVGKVGKWARMTRRL